MPRFFKSIPFHPFFFAIYPVLALYAFNMGQSRLTDAVRVFLIIPALAGLVLISLKVLLKDWGRAALLTSFVFLLFFSYGHLVNRLSSSRFGPFLERVPWLVAIVYLIIFLAGVYLIAIRMKAAGDLTFGLNIMGLVLLIVPLYSIVSFRYINRNPSQVDFIPANQEPAPVFTKTQELPDIYYIIPDGYAREDVLKTLYDLDNTEFLSFLESSGFYVASDSHANYDQTALSVSSTLNLDYLDGYARELGVDSQNRDVLYNAIDHSRLRQLLEAAGYTFVDINSGNPITQIKDATYYLTPSRSLVINYFEREILANSVIGRVVENDLVDQYRARLVNEFELGASLGWIESPKFVFIHIVAPHPPFVFDAAGNPVDPPELVMRDGSRYPGSREDYLYGYREQLLFVNHQLETMISAILAQSDMTPVIILQGDHGPGAYLDWSSADKSCIVERTAILNAYLIPGVDPSELYAEITPVNTFRLVLNTILGTDYRMLPDRTYMPTWDMPYDFIDVTDTAESCNLSGNE
jgi:hypothetical protein